MGAFSTSASAKGKTVGARPIAVILGEIVTRAKDFTNADGAAIAIRDGDAAVTRATTGGIAPDLGVRLSIEGSFAGMALAQGTALHCEDSDSDARVDAEKCRLLKTRSFVVVPIRGEGPKDFVGVLAVFSSSPHAFTRTDLAVLKTTADQVAYELKNVRPTDTSLTGAPPSIDAAAPVLAAELVPESPVKASKPEPITTPDSQILEPSAPTSATSVAPAVEKPPVSKKKSVAPAPPPPTTPPPEVARMAEAEAVAPPLLDVKFEIEPPSPPKTVSATPARITKLSAPEPRSAPSTRKEETVVSLAEAIERPVTPITVPASTPAVRPAVTPPKQQSKSVEAPNTSPLAPNAYEEWRGFATVEETPKKSNKGLVIGGAAAVIVVVAVLGVRSFISRDSSNTSAPNANSASSTTSATQAQSTSPASTTAAPPTAPIKTAEVKENRSTSTAAEAAKPAAKEPAPKPAAFVANSSGPARRGEEPETAAPQIGMAPAVGFALPETKAIVPSGPKVKQSQIEQSELIRKVPPRFPTFPPNLPASETVILRATVQADGSVGNVQAVKGARAFADAAIAAVKQWKYKPAKMNGNPVETSVEVVLNFRK